MNTETKTQLINQSNLEIVYNLLRIVRNKTIKNIIEILSQSKKTQVEVMIELSKKYQSKLDQSAVSQKLSDMAEHNLIECERKGKYIEYSLNIETFQRIEYAITKFSKL